jgi:hypothetical protein
MRAGGSGGRAAALAALFLAGCAGTSHVVTGTPHPAMSPSRVTVYSTAPPLFQEIAVIRAHRKTLFNGGGQRSTEVVLERLKVEAAKLGANGLLLDGFDQAQTLSLGGGAGTDSYSAHGIVSLSLGAVVGVFKTTGQGRAIYVPGAAP